jgi:hypothetical protein
MSAIDSPIQLPQQLRPMNPPLIGLAPSSSSLASRYTRPIIDV